MGSKAFKPTLDNTKKILDFIGNPEKKLKFVHVAGSNGKGSVSCMLASMLTESGKKVGLFTSPHIVDFTERIRINGSPIDMNSVNEFISIIKNHKFDFEPSFFEITFAMALNHFKNSNCDICVLETGLGGRLDATNVVSPDLCIITSISLEHTNMLGDTLEKIAAEKAGIIKPSANLVLGNIQDEIMHIFTERTKKNGVKLIESQFTNIEAYEDNFIVDYQKENLRTVICAVNELIRLDYSIDSSTIDRGIQNLRTNSGYFGRFQIMEKSPLLIYDVSHNADGIKATLKSLEKIKSGQLHIIYGTSEDKNLSEISKVFPSDAHYYFTEFSNPRSASIQSLESQFSGTNLKSTHYYSEAQRALNSARDNSSETDTILVIGSFFLLSDFF